MFSLKVCVYLNKYGKVGPHLDQRRILQLPDHFGPGRASSVLQQCVQACVDSAHNQATVFSCLKSGQGGEVVSGNADDCAVGVARHVTLPRRRGSASFSVDRVPCPAFFDQRQHTLTLPTVSSVTYVLRFLEKLCHNLHCDALFGSQPVARGSLHYNSHSYSAGQSSCCRRSHLCLQPAKPLSAIAICFSCCAGEALEQSTPLHCLHLKVVVLDFASLSLSVLAWLIFSWASFREELTN